MSARRGHFVSHTLAFSRTAWPGMLLEPCQLLRCPPRRASFLKQASAPLCQLKSAPAEESAVARQWGRRHATVAAVRRSARVGADASQSARSRANGTGAAAVTSCEDAARRSGEGVSWHVASCRHRRGANCMWRWGHARTCCRQASARDNGIRLWICPAQAQESLSRQEASGT